MKDLVSSKSKKMKQFILSTILLLILANISCKNKNNHLPNDIKPAKSDSSTINSPKLTINISGEWHWQTKGSDFTLYLNQKLDSLKGSYCAIAYNGNRIDCDNETPPTSCLIKGRIQGDSAIILFNSAWSKEFEKDTAKIKFNEKNNTLTWTSSKRNIISYVPMKAILKK